MNVTELEECINEYGKDIYAFCRQLVYNQQDADELYQDTFLKAMELLDHIETGRNPKSYLLSISIRLWKNRKRKSAWRNRIAQMESLSYEEGEVEVKSDWSMEEEILRREQLKEIREAVSQLEEKYRLPICLYYMEGLSITDIAKILKLPQGTVKSRLYQARKLLKNQLSFETI